MRAERIRGNWLGSTPSARVIGVATEARRRSVRPSSAARTAQPSTVLCLAFSIGPVWGDHFDALLLSARRAIAVVRAIANQIVRLRFDHVEVEGQLDQRDLVMVRGVRADGERQAMPIDDRHDFYAFSALRRTDLLAAPLRGCERGIDEALRLVDAPSSRSVFASSVSAARTLRSGTTAESDDAPSCSLGSTAEACATARRCSGSTAPLPRLYVSELACGPPIVRIFSSGKCFRMSSHCSSVMRSTQQFYSCHAPSSILR